MNFLYQVATHKMYYSSYPIGPSSSRCLFVIDEVGKMELFSSSFVKCVQSLFKSTGSKPHPPPPPPGFEQDGGGDSVIVLATIPIARQRSHWLVEELRHREDCLLFEVKKLQLNF